MVTVDDVRTFAMTRPRTTEALVRDRIKFRVGRIVYVAFTREETMLVLVLAAWRMCVPEKVSALVEGP
jgi:hypothetical protein